MTTNEMAEVIDRRNVEPSVSPHPPPRERRENVHHGTSLTNPLCMDQARRLAATLFVVPFAMSLTAIVAAYGLARSDSNNRLAPATAIAAGFLLLCSGVAPAIVFAERRRYNREEQQREEDCAQLSAAVRALPDKTIQDLALVNFMQMRRFTTIAQRQARMSFYASVVASSCVLFTLAAGGAATVGLGSLDAQIIGATLTTATSALGAFLTATFVRSYAMATKQMSYYYGQPLVHCYLLHASWLASEPTRLPTSAEAQWERIIAATLQAAHDAQVNLLTL